MNLVLDTSVIMAVITNESHKRRLIEMTQSAELIAPSSLHWEIGSAFSAMFRRNRITLRQSIAAPNAHRQKNIGATVSNACDSRLIKK